MIIAVDFDSTLVDEWGRKFSDTTSPLKLMGGARKALEGMKAAGHLVVVASARANRALRIDPELDPLVRAGVVKVDRKAWDAEQPLHEARYQQMVQFCATTLKGLVDAVDDLTPRRPGQRELPGHLVVEQRDRRGLRALHRDIGRDAERKEQLAGVLAGRTRRHDDEAALPRHELER